MSRRMRSGRLLLLGLVVVGAGAVPARAWFFPEWKSGIEWSMPPVIDPGTASSAPSDAIVLFDGTDLSAWEGGEKWTIENGYAIDQGNIRTKEKFGDCQLHLEFASPEEVKGSGQGRGNSGVYLMGHYEVQILDSYNNETYFDGQCGSIYKQHPPLVNACRKPGEWQSYDIIFTAPRFNDDRTVKSPGYVTVLHNEVLVQNHFELLGDTKWDAPPSYNAHADRESISLQFHGNPVRFRNIWIRDLMPAPAEVPPSPATPEATGESSSTPDAEASETR